jgi:N-acetylneuraminic acid mutarotase
MNTPFNFLTFSTIVLAAVACHPNNLPDTQLGDWVQAAPIGADPRSNSVSFVMGDKAYVGLGYNEHVGGLGRLTDFWSFTVSDGWRQLQDFPGAPRSHAAGFALGNYGYVGTGYDGFNTYSDFYQYDTAQNQWTKKASFPGGPRYDAVGFAVQEKGYIGTGYNVYWMNDFYQYDPQKDAWTATSGTSGNFSKRQGAMVFVYQNQAYIVGGGNNGTMVRDFWRFDPSQSSPWHQLNDITNTNQATFDDGYKDIERQNGVAFINGDQAFLTTGTNGTAVTSTWAYDFAADLWSQRTPYPRQPRSGAVAFTVSGKSYLGTGNTGSNSTFDDFEQFLPTVPFNANDF